MLQLRNGHYFVDSDEYRELEQLVHQVYARYEGRFVFNQDASYLTYQEIYTFFTEIFYKQLESSPEKSDYFKRFHDEGMIAYARYIEDVRTVLDNNLLAYTETNELEVNTFHHRPKGEGFSATTLF